MIHCLGGYCEMCPVKIQLECEMTTKDRIGHIRQCLRRLKPTMGFELAAAAEIEKELVELEQIIPVPSQCPVCRASLSGAMLEAMTLDVLSGDTW